MRPKPVFYAFIRYLKAELPAPNGKPVRVRTRKRKTLCASLLSDSKSHRITINNDLEFDSVIDALCHEWAHLLDWKKKHRDWKEEHRQSWGRQYAKVYQHYRRFRDAWDVTHPEDRNT